MIALLLNMLSGIFPNDQSEVHKFLVLSAGSGHEFQAGSSLLSPPSGSALLIMPSAIQLEIVASEFLSSHLSTI